MVVEDAHPGQEQVFDRLTDDWTEQQRHDFHRAMTSLIEPSHP